MRLKAPHACQASYRVCSPTCWHLPSPSFPFALSDADQVHYPASWAGVGGPALRKEGWLAMEAWARRTGKAKALGVSHYCKRHLDDVLSVAREPVALNQVHPPPGAHTPPRPCTYDFANR